MGTQRQIISGVVDFHIIHRYHRQIIAEVLPASACIGAEIARRSVPTKSTLGLYGSTAKAFTGAFGRLLVMSVQVSP